MFSTLATSVLLLTSFAAANPVPQKRSSVAIPLAPRANHAVGPNKVFNRHAVLKERRYVRNKYAKVGEKASTAAPIAVQPAQVVKRDTTSGADSLTDVFSGIDQCQCLLTIPLRRTSLTTNDFYAQFTMGPCKVGSRFPSSLSQANVMILKLVHLHNSLPSTLTLARRTSSSLCKDSMLDQSWSLTDATRY